MKQTVSEFYDEYVERQLKAGIHQRHLSIQRWLEKFNMPKTGIILEIGCGIGSQTQLILQYLKSRSNLISVDISEKSIAIAKQRFRKYSNLTLIAGDIIKLKIVTQFDTIVLPDVIEHIPINQHFFLFKKLSELLKEDGFILIHIPHPNYLDWLKKNEPGELQIIDNPIFTDKLLNNVYPHGLYITFLKSYSIFNSPEDYQIIVLRKKTNISYVINQSPINDTIIRRAKRKLKLLIRGK